MEVVEKQCGIVRPQKILYLYNLLKTDIFERGLLTAIFALYFHAYLFDKISFFTFLNGIVWFIISLVIITILYVGSKEIMNYPHYYREYIEWVPTPYFNKYRI